MNEEEIRLLRAAAGYFDNDPTSVPASEESCLSNELAPGENLSSEELENAIQQLLQSSAQENAASSPEAPPAPSTPGNHGQSLTANESNDHDLDALVAQNVADLASLLGFDSKAEANGPGDVGRGVSVSENRLAISSSTTRSNTPPSSLQGDGLANSTSSLDLDELSRANINIEALVRNPQFALMLASQMQHNGTSYSREQSRNSSQSPGPRVVQHRRVVSTQDSIDPDKSAAREKVREENRERKKRWREVNQDRNKDNDLRCRVTKRASKIYGMGQSPEKTRWIDDEFAKRRQKRELKERSRTDGPETSICAGSSTVFSATGSFDQSYASSPSYPRGSILTSQVALSELLNLCGVAGPVTPEMILRISSQIAQNPTLTNRFHEIVGGNLQMPSNHFAHSNNVQTSPETDLSLLLQATASGPSSTFEPSITSQNNTIGENGMHSSKLEEDNLEELLANVQSALENSVPSDHAEDDSTLPNLDELLASFADVTPDLNDAQPLDMLIEGVSDDTTIDPLATASSAEENLEKFLAENNINIEDMDLDGLLDMAAPSSEESTSPTGDMQTAELGRTEESTVVEKPGPSDEPGLQIKIEVNPIDESLAVLGDLEIPEGFENMPMDELNALIEEFGVGADGTFADARPATDDNALQAPQPSASSVDTQAPSQIVQNNPPAPPPPRPLPITYGRDHDTSSQYTQENVMAILSVLLENSDSGPVHPPSYASRGIKRPSASRQSQPIKRHRPHSPAASLGQLDMYGAASVGPKYSSHHHQTIDHSRVSPAYAASFGNSDTMNKRLIAMKPPPYRPGGGGPSTPPTTGLPGISVAAKKKSGEDEKKIKAMGFPPMLTSIKKV